MTTMVPLRTLALTSNVLFSLYGLVGHIYPVLVLHVILMPINLTKLIELRSHALGHRNRRTHCGVVTRGEHDIGRLKQMKQENEKCRGQDTACY